MRKHLVVFIAAAALVVGLAVPMVLAGIGTHPVDRQAIFNANAAQKSSKTWSDIPGISDVGVCMASGFWSADLSLTATGGAFRVRLKVEDQVREVVHFDPTATQRTFSALFAGPAVSGNNDVAFQWRSARGDTVRLQHGWAAFYFQDCP